MGNRIVDIVWVFGTVFFCDSGVGGLWGLDAYDLWDGVWRGWVSAFLAKVVDYASGFLFEPALD